MREVYNILQQLRSDNSNTYKLSVLTKYKNNIEFKEFLKAVYNPRVNYYIKQIPEYDVTPYTNTTDDIKFWNILDMLSTRKATGNKAKELVKKFLDNTDEVYEDLLLCVLGRDIKANVSVKTINKVWHNLIPETPYMRCSKLDEKTMLEFPDGGNYYLQKKADGIFSYIIKTTNTVYIVTRQGNSWSSLNIGIDCSGGDWTGVLVGEALIKDEDGLEFDRKTGNGLINSFIKQPETLDTFITKNSHKSDFENLYEDKLGEYMRIDNRLHFEVWDYLTLDEFELNFSKRPYSARLECLTSLIEEREFDKISLIPTVKVSSVKEAKSLANKYIEDGFEGGILKRADLKFENKTSKYQLKIKAELDCDLRCVGIEPGTGKYEGMIGALVLETDDKYLKVNVGTGLTDKDREKDTSEYLGKVIEVKYNELITNKTNNTYSLFLPVFVEVRDKNTTDTIEDLK